MDRDYARRAARLGFNTIANWSDWEIARAALFPYVRPLAWGAREAPFIYRDFPDVFDPRWDADAPRFGEQLAGHARPIGVHRLLPHERAHLGLRTRDTSSRDALQHAPMCDPACARRRPRKEIRRRSRDSPPPGGSRPTLAAVRRRRWSRALTPPAERDLAEFSAVMVEKFFGALSASCRRVDPNHLNLGIRYHTIPPEWAVSGMRSFDVFSMNCYDDAGDVRAKWRRSPRC